MSNPDNVIVDQPRPTIVHVGEEDPEAELLEKKKKEEAARRTNECCSDQCCDCWVDCTDCFCLGRLCCGANGCCDDSPSSGAGAALDTDSHNNDGCCDDLDCGDCSGGDCNCDCDC